MDIFAPSTYGDHIADIYDVWHDPRSEGTRDCVAFLTELADGGSALELGIGTGRVALPLAERGVRVVGIDASQNMIAKLCDKPGGADIEVHVGDFGDLSVPGRFSLVFAVFATFFGLVSQDAQVRCFRRVADRLEPGGSFVIEAFVPDLTRFDRGQRVSATAVSADEARLDVNRHDPVSQIITGQHISISEKGITMYPVQIRYAWPSELDLMARLAGLRLAERWSGWKGERFLADSGRHVSVYRKPRD